MKRLPWFALALGAVALTLSARFSSLGNAQTTTIYFVATNGNDANTGTSATTPWRTIGKAARTAVAGSTVRVRGGTYNERVTVTVSGSASAGFTTFESHPGETAIVDGTNLAPPSGETGLFYVKDRSYLRIKGFELRNYKTSNASLVPTGIRVQGASHHIEILGNRIHHIESNSSNGNAHGIAVYGSNSTTPVSDLVIDGNEVYSNKLGWSEAIVLNGNVSGFAVTANLVRDNNNIGIDFIGFEGTCSNSTCDQARNGRCAGNRLYRNGTTANANYGNQPSAASIYVDGGRDIVIEHNEVSESDFGVELASEHAGRATSNITLRNNFIHRNRLAGLAIGGYDTQRGSTSSCKIINNTFFQNDTLNDGVGELYVQFDTRNNVIKNNVFYASSQNVFIYNEYTQNTGNVVDFNVYYSTAGATGATFRWKNVLYRGWSNYQKTATATRSGNDEKSKFINPLLVSTSTTAPNLHLQAASPAIDMGDGSVVLPADLDIDREPRIQGSKVDVGADEVSVATPTVPSTPSGLIGTGGPGHASLSWTDNANNETGFVIERKTPAEAAFADVATLGANVTAFTELLPAGTYEYRVRASNAIGSSGVSNLVSVTVTPPPTPPAAPSDLTATGGEAQVVLSWTDNASDETAFKIERRSEPAGNFAEIATTGANVTSYTNVGLAGGDYSYRVRASNAAGASDYAVSGIVTVTAPPPPPGPAAPSNLNATTADAQVALTWTDNASSETGFRVERKVGTGAWASLAIKAANATGHTDTSVPAGGASYRVVATGTVDSPASNEVNVVLFAPVVDTFVRNPGSPTSPASSFGTSTALEIKSDNSAAYQRNAFLRFPLTGLGANVTSATLRLYGKAAVKEKGTTAFRVADVTWPESMTWHYPTAGAGGPALGAELGTKNTPLADTWIEWDVTAYVQAQRAAGAMAISVGLKSAVISGDGQTRFHSREGLQKPVLIVSTRP